MRGTGGYDHKAKLWDVRGPGSVMTVCTVDLSCTFQFFFSLVSRLIDCIITSLG